jgi:hypothetical protein
MPEVKQSRTVKQRREAAGVEQRCKKWVVKKVYSKMPVIPSHG